MHWNAALNSFNDVTKNSIIWKVHTGIKRLIIQRICSKENAQENGLSVAGEKPSKHILAYIELNSVFKLVTKMKVMGVELRSSVQTFQL